MRSFTTVRARNCLAAQQLPFRRPEMRSTVVKRSVIIAGHKTSVSLEGAFWKALKEIAVGRGANLSELVTAIDVERRQGNLSSCLRLVVLDFYRCRLIEMRGGGAASDVPALRRSALRWGGLPPVRA